MQVPTCAWLLFPAQGAQPNPAQPSLACAGDTAIPSGSGEVLMSVGSVYLCQPPCDSPQPFSKHKSLQPRIKIPVRSLGDLSLQPREGKGGEMRFGG